MLTKMSLSDLNQKNKIIKICVYFLLTETDGDYFRFITTGDENCLLNNRR